MKLGNIQNDISRGMDTTYFCENIGPMFQQTHSKLEHVHCQFTLISHFLEVKKQYFYLKFVEFTWYLNTSKIVIIVTDKKIHNHKNSQFGNKLW